MKMRSLGRLPIMLLVFGALIGILLYILCGVVNKDTQCKIKLKAVYSALIFYFDEYQHLPIYSEWCDLLIQEADLSRECFTCISFEEAGSLIINENHPIDWNAPANMVLVYEGQPGWNQMGSKDKILPLHRNGCYILFSNGNIEYVKKEDFADLLWSADQMADKEN